MDGGSRLATLQRRKDDAHCRSRPPHYAHGMWDVLTWHDGTLAIAWWAVIVLVVALLSIGGAAAARRN